MSELHRDRDLRMFAHRSQDRLQRGLGGVIPQPEASRGDAADRFHSGRLDAEYRCTRQRQRVDVGEMPISGPAVFGGILAHRRHHDAVGKRQAAQLESEKTGRSCGFFLGNSGREDGLPLCSGPPRFPQPQASGSAFHLGRHLAVTANTTSRERRAWPAANRRHGSDDPAAADNRPRRRTRPPAGHRRAFQSRGHRPQTSAQSRDRLTMNVRYSLSTKRLPRRHSIVDRLWLR